jgi:hypothetical protein
MKTPYYDISNTVELPITVSAATLRERLLPELQLLNIKTEVLENDNIIFRVSPMDVSTRSFRLHGVSSGKINLTNLNNKSVLHYQIMTIQARLFYIFFSIVIILFLSVEFITKIHDSGACLLLVFMIGALIMTSFGFAFSKIVVAHNFESFIRSVITNTEHNIQIK